MGSATRRDKVRSDAGHKRKGGRDDGEEGKHVGSCGTQWVLMFDAVCTAIDELIYAAGSQRRCSTLR